MDGASMRPPPRAPAPVPPPDEVPEIGRGLAPTRAWDATNRPLARIEDAFAAVVLVSLLTLGTLTFGYAFDSLATAQAASTRASR